MLPYGRQDVSDADIAAVVEVLRSDFLTQGPAVPRFEEAVAARCGVDHAVAVNNATAALHLACLALGLGPGDLLWTSPITFVASANAARFCGADVDFVDVDPHSGNMCTDALARKLESADRSGRLPKILMPVHLAGEPCDMEEISALARRFGVRIIEDASHAIGADYRGAPVGSCSLGDMAVFSFHPVKIITTGEGGMVTTRDPALAERVRLLRSHGVTRDPALMVSEPHGDWYYEQVALGFNYRLTDIQAALGLSQLSRLTEFVDARHQLAARYNERLSGVGVGLPRLKQDRRSALHLFVVHVPSSEGRDKRAEVYSRLRKEGIGVNVHYIPVHLQPYYRNLGFKAGDFPNAERYYSSALTIPLFPSMSESDQDRVVAALVRALA